MSLQSDCQDFTKKREENLYPRVVMLAGSQPRSVFSKVAPDGTPLCCVPDYELGNCSAGQFIDAFVVFVSGVTADPMPGDIMLLDNLVERAPQVGVSQRLGLLGRPPAPAETFPARHPSGDPLLQIFRIGIEINAARLFQGFERFNSGNHLHAVIGRLRGGAAQFSLVLAVAEQRAPPARAGVAGAGAVGVDGYVGWGHGVLGVRGPGLRI